MVINKTYFTDRWPIRTLHKSELIYRLYSSGDCYNAPLVQEPFEAFKRCRKTGIKKHATCFATLLPNELNSDVVRFTTLIKPALQ